MASVQQPLQEIPTGTPQQIWGGNSPGSSISFYNSDTANTVYLGYQQAITIGGVNTIPLGPGMQVTIDGGIQVWAIGAKGTAATIVGPGVSSFFLPTSLSGLGGIKVFIQATAPTQPPTIPVNSLWLQLVGGVVIGFSTWNGSAWVAQQFNASDVIAVGTIVANLIAAGTIVAGIIDGTTVNAATFNGSTFNGTNWIENASGQFLYNGTPAAGNLIASIAPAAGTDGFGNGYKSGFTVYGPSGGFTNLAGAVTSPVMNMYPSGAVHVGFDPHVLAGVLNPGAANEILQIVTRSGSPSGLTADATAVVLSARANDGSTIPVIQFFVGNTPVMACEPTVVTFAEPIDASAGILAPWTNASLGAGFGAGSGTPRYRLESMGGGIVRLDGTVVTTAVGGTAANATMFTLPVGMRPTSNKRLMGVSSSSSYITSNLGTTLVQILSSGAVTCVPACSGAGQQIVLDGITFPVD